MTLVNSATINANAGGGQNVLYIQTRGGTTNTGTLEATSGSTLSLYRKHLCQHRGNDQGGGVGLAGEFAERGYDRRRNPDGLWRRG